ncbi:MAG: hypothetical protein ACRENP_29500 [Longimicrobiales bacterium]
MIGKMLKMYAYTKAPKATFAVLHPRTSARVAHMRHDFKHSWALRASAVGAALIALPVGYLVGRLAARSRPAWVEDEVSRTELGTGL